MILRYKIIENKKLVYVTGTGTLTFAELMRHIEELYQDPKYKAPMKKLIDYRQITKYALSLKEAQIFAQKKISFGNIFSGEKCATVAPSDIGFGMARAHDAHIEGSNIETAAFRDFEQALNWLGIELDDAETDIISHAR
ncbi:MAG: hypothetical protein KKH68_02240 [Proteobacteria bacterium]|nr:hypothetical protein [Pseudomonadota bacterium]